MFVKKTFVFFLLLICAVLIALAAKIQIQYCVIVNGRTIGFIPQYRDGVSVVEKLQADFHDKTLSTSVFPCFTKEKPASDIHALLGTARANLGLEISYRIENTTIPFSEETVEDASLFKNETKITANGCDGSMQRIIKVTTINNEVQHEEVISECMTSEPIARVMAVGTKSPLPGVGTGTFTYPLPVISVSSDYGQRWGRMHGGIDFAAESGTDILAADAGIVSHSGAVDGFGNLIILDHQNGFHTYYAHCSKLYVPYGKSVQKGEVIGAVGSTGNSTGPHLHFEIRKNGETQNPALYISL